MEADLAAEMEEVANAVCLAIQCNEDHNQQLMCSNIDHDLQDCSRLDRNHITEAISLEVANTTYLKRVLAVGVVIGSSLASLRNFSYATSEHDDNNYAALQTYQFYNHVVEPKVQISQKVIPLPIDGINHGPPVPEINSSNEGGDYFVKFST